MSGEHVFSEWAHEYLPSEIANMRSVGRRDNGVEYIEKVDRRQGSMKERKLPAVCEICNNVWMSALETEAKPILIPLFKGERISLEADQQNTLVKWLVLKLMVLEQSNPPGVVFSQANRTAFYDRREIPEATYILIGKMSRIRTASPILSLSNRAIRRNPQGLDITAGTGPNLKLVAMNFGDLFVYAIYSTEFDLDPQIGPPTKAILVWPSNGNIIEWPLSDRIEPEDVEYLGGFLDRLAGKTLPRPSR